MRYLISFTYLILALIALSCENQDTTSEQPIDPNDKRIKMIDCVGSLHLFTDAASIKEVSIVNDSLKLKVVYGGGCEKHDFVLYGCKTFMESNPIQAAIYLSHDAHGDLCKALITETLAFDLALLKELGKQTYQDLHQIILQIREPKATDPFKPLPSYDF